MLTKDLVDSPLRRRSSPAGQRGFLGLDGAGNSTTMRTMLDIDRSTSSSITFDGQRFSKLDSPSRVVGFMLDANAVEVTAGARDYRSTGETMLDTSIASRVGTLVRRPVRKRTANSATGPA